MAPKSSKPAAVPEGDEASLKRKADAAELATDKEAKEAKVDDKAEASVEKEQDAPVDKRKQITAPVGFEPQDLTLNVIPTTGGRLLMSLSEGGMQYLVGGARGNHGVKTGRYFFEARIVEMLPPDARAPKTQAALPKQHVRIGVSTTESEIFLGDADGGVCFDSEGFFFAEKKKQAQGGLRFGRDVVVGILINLDEKSENANTISLFVEGKRASQPHKLPESFKGKALFPHLAFRNVSMQINFGPEPMAPLPFTCRMLSAAATTDVVKAKAQPTSGGKCDVVFPVSLPDEGSFDWLDTFLEANPHFTELSDRKIIDWATKSGVHKPKSSAWKNSNDKPDAMWGVPTLDDFSARKVINAISPLMPRNYVVMEVKGNLVKTDRSELLSRFNSAHFRKVAKVAVGEPSKAYKERVYENLLKIKQAKSDGEHKAKKAQKEFQRKQKQQAKQVAANRKQAEEKKKADAAAKKEGEGDADEGGAEKKEDVDMKKEDDDAEAVKEEASEDEEPMDEEAPEAELTAEEKKQWFKASVVKDLTEQELAKSFGNFTLPEKDEGFDAIDFEWQKGSKAQDYLKQWLVQKKMTTRVEDIQASEWFSKTYAEWQKTASEWQAKQKEGKAEAVKKAATKEKKEGEAAGEEKKEGEGESKEAEEAPTKAVDALSVENVLDIGEGVPLFANFMFEDWAMMSLRFELHLLVKSFKKDVADPDRGVHESHLAFYYNKYYRKGLNTKFFGQATIEGVVEMIKDTVTIDAANKCVVPVLDADGEETAPFDMFVKITEDERQKRQKRIEAGDDTAKLKFSVLATTEKGGATAPKNVPPPKFGAAPKAANWAAAPGGKDWAKGASRYGPPAGGKGGGGGNWGGQSWGRGW